MADHKGPGILQWIAQPAAIATVLPSSAGGVANRRTQVARVQVDTDKARGWSVVMSPIAFAGFAVDPVLSAPEPILCALTWGWDAVNFTAEIDWPAGGGRFDVWGDNVNVDLLIPASYQSDPALPTPDPSASVTAGATIQPGATLGGMRPTRSILMPLLVGGTFSAPIPVPRFARAMRWHQVINLTAGNTPIPLFLAGSQDATLAFVTQTTPTDAIVPGIANTTGGYTSSERTWPGPDGWTLCPQTRFITIGNLDVPGNDVSLRLEFVLDL